MTGRKVLIFAIVTLIVVIVRGEVEEESKEIIYGEKKGGVEEEEVEEEEEAEGGVTEAWIMRRPFHIPPPHPRPFHPRPPIHAYHNPLPPRPRTPMHPRPLPHPPARPTWPREKSAVQVDDGGGHGYWGGQRSRVRSSQGYLSNGSLTEALNVLWTSRDGGHARNHNYGTSHHDHHNQNHRTTQNNRNYYYNQGDDHKYDGYDYQDEDPYNYVSYDHENYDHKRYNVYDAAKTRNTPSSNPFTPFTPPSSPPFTPYNPPPTTPTPNPSRLAPYPPRVNNPPVVNPHGNVRVGSGVGGMGVGGDAVRGGVSSGAVPPHTPVGPLGVPPRHPPVRPPVGRQPHQPAPPRVQPVAPLTPLHPPIAPGHHHPHIRLHPAPPRLGPPQYPAPAYPRAPAPPPPWQPPPAPLHLTPHEAVQLNRILSDPLWRRHFLGAANRAGLADTGTGDSTPVITPLSHLPSGPYGGVGGGWMNGVGAAVGGVANSLPSLEKAVTTMSFMAFGIFMANLLVQALANVSMGYRS
ncbi:inactive histone-lysine N-methyltransferase 2E-like [Eriocheir sinensis]|uniref:inactive histone-lysine N-methyltransferase 2E-like n=1 Tax=Eriocheir sinensis TaxID=95602 RepID=UPI0021C7506E|nr:inactive histone-lysine N-methyltransferase 2E-like [Eriocheir sinensis]